MRLRSSASLLFVIIQESIIWMHPSIDSNNLESETGDLRYPAPLVFFSVTYGLSDQVEEHDIKYLLTITRDDWSLCLKIIVKRE